MKQNIPVFVFFSSLFLFLACKKIADPGNSIKIQNHNLSIEEAKKHFESVISSSNQNSSALYTARFSSHKIPRWNSARKKIMHQGSVAVIVPLQKSGSYIQVSNKKMMHFGFLNYMLMYKDTLNAIVTEWVQLKPSENWIFSRKSRKYDGNILVKNWDGKLKKVYSYDDGQLLATNKRKSPILNAPLTRMNNEDDPWEEDDDPEENEDDLCFVTQTITVVKTPKKCPCMEHTYEQYDACNCYQKPEPGENISYTLTYEIDCPEIPEDPPSGGGGGNNGGGETPAPGETGGGGGAGGEDYPPLSCNPDPNYEVPTDPPPPGTEYILPCSELELPVDDLPQDWGVDFSTDADRLIAFYNQDSDPSMHLGTEESNWIYEHPAEVAQLLQYMSTEDESVKEFGRWAILFLTQNEELNFEIFRNKYLTPFVVGFDGAGEYLDNEFWNDPTLSFPPQQLPTLAQFDAAYPRSNGGPMLSTDVYIQIGGQVLANHQADPISFSNACALRVSRALNNSGITIPAISNKTLTGADGKNYFYRAHDLAAWMRKTFTTYLTVTGTQGGEFGQNFDSYLAGKKGIYIMIPNYPAKFGASGHADFWDGIKCVNGCYFNLSKYGGVYRVYFWELN
ncbi:type VI secretion system amidase effector protein Tae4 [Parasegetibacter sp. NRK P23]|uniref:type VI secretion system amidase effector protein Tae4 n=1 Tax=Parasegetibacter sp. NRK P23 TaxID=2942999 RepID=UPI0020444E07|nr:type VI secretion system amidase effector protein Tae4 [Parasegetibacter sp. NRK P23]MCM5527902.1 type VI secretion system amidase effector protein Tae4 [Parasegetibacter sp. NRK P23]